MQTSIYNKFYLNFKSQPLLNKKIQKIEKFIESVITSSIKFIYSTIKAIKKQTNQTNKFSLTLINVVL